MTRMLDCRDPLNRSEAIAAYLDAVAELDDPAIAEDIRVLGRAAITKYQLEIRN